MNNYQGRKKDYRSNQYVNLGPGPNVPRINLGPGKTIKRIKLGPCPPGKTHLPAEISEVVRRAEESQKKKK